MTAYTKCMQCDQWVQAFSPTIHVCKPERQLTQLDTQLHPQTKPLSDEEIENIAGSCCHGATAWHNPELDIHEFARAIEERHGIK